MKVWIVLKDWENEASYEDYENGHDEFVGVFESLEAAKAHVDKIEADLRNEWSNVEGFKITSSEDYFVEHWHGSNMLGKIINKIVEEFIGCLSPDIDTIHSHYHIFEQEVSK